MIEPRLATITTARKNSPMVPRDAASLIVLDKTAGGPWRVLMGRRRADLAFMPGKYVFPGGRVDRADDTALSTDSLEPSIEARLIKSLKARQSQRRARGLALAAIRETFEETGRLIGSPLEGVSSRNEAWQAFHAHGLAPAISGLRYLARAVTPPGRPRRFDTRFLFATADTIGRTLDDGAHSGELEDVLWVSLSDARALDLPPITLVILEDLEARLTAHGAGPADIPVPTYKFLNGKFRRTLV